MDAGLKVRFEGEKVFGARPEWGALPRVRKGVGGEMAPKRMYLAAARRFFFLGTEAFDEENGNFSKRG